MKLFGDARMARQGGEGGEDDGYDDQESMSWSFEAR